MNLKGVEDTWREQCPEEAYGLVGKRKLPKKWQIMLNNYNRRKSICSICFNKFNPKDLNAMPDGGSGGICKECE